jgi:hypothetical protein
VRRTTIDFEVRADTDAAAGEVEAALAGALGCTFRDGRHHQVPARVAETFGVTLHLRPWRGVGGKRVVQFGGEVTDDRLFAVPAGEQLDVDVTDLSRYVTDLLTVRTPYTWYVPSAEDWDAEQEHARQVDAAFEGDHDPPEWA